MMPRKVYNLVSQLKTLAPIEIPSMDKDLPFMNVLLAMLLNIHVLSEEEMNTFKSSKTAKVNSIYTLYRRLPGELAVPIHQDGKNIYRCKQMILTIKISSKSNIVPI